MNTTIQELLREFIRDKRLLLAVVLLFLVATSFVIYIGFSVQPSELQVVTRYSAFGATHFYRSQWYYLVSFGLFGFIAAALHIILAARMVVIKNKSFALAFLWLCILLIVIAWITSQAILKIAGLS